MSRPKIIGIIPARYQSTRFPGKVLADVGGKSMIRRVYEQADQAAELDKVVVATDDDLVVRHVVEWAGNVCLTRNDHTSGTDRCFEALSAQSEKYDYVINIQGDEPFIRPEQIDALARELNGEVSLATMIKKVTTQEELLNPSEVKVVFNQDSEALYFSRSVIPHLRNVPEDEWVEQDCFYKHIGMYAYRADVLRSIASLQESRLEKSESLEQLRWLESGYPIKLVITEFDSVCIDTEEDLKNVMVDFGKYAI